MNKMRCDICRDESHENEQHYCGCCGGYGHSRRKCPKTYCDYCGRIVGHNSQTHRCISCNYNKCGGNGISQCYIPKCKICYGKVVNSILSNINLYKSELFPNNVIDIILFHVYMQNDNSKYHNLGTRYIRKDNFAHTHTNHNSITSLSDVFRVNYRSDSHELIYNDYIFNAIQIRSIYNSTYNKIYNKIPRITESICNKYILHMNKNANNYNDEDVLNLISKFCDYIIMSNIILISKQREQLANKIAIILLQECNDNVLYVHKINNIYIEYLLLKNINYQS